MEITHERISKLFALYDELDALKEQASDAIKAAQDFQGNRVLINRTGGGQQEVTEKMLWDEVWNLSADSDAGRFLRKKYPEAFERSDEANKKAVELREFTLGELGIDAQQIKLSDIIKLTQALIRFELQNHVGGYKDNTGAGDTAA